MTILVGILCQDGVVIGSDSSATFTAGSFRTIEQPIPNKTQVVGDEILYGGTGSVGLGQRFHALLTSYVNTTELRKSGEAIHIGKEISKLSVQDFSSTGASNGTFGALLGCANKNKGFCLIEFSIADMQPELKTPLMWFSSMGSGQPIVDPFLGLIRKSLFANSQPKLNEGIFAVTWALQHAIELNPGGINGPMQVGVVAMDKTNKFIEARLLSEADLSEHHQNVDAITKHIGDYRDILNGSKDEDLRSPPALANSPSQS